MVKVNLEDTLPGIYLQNIVSLPSADVMGNDPIRRKYKRIVLIISDGFGRKL